MNQIEINKILKETYEHLWNGRHKLALKNAEKLFNEKPQDSEAAIIYSWALLENGFPTKSLELANLAVELEGDEIRTSLCRGYVLMRLGILDGAVADLDKSIIQQRSLLSWTYQNKAKSLAGLYKFTDAKLCLKICQLLDTNGKKDWDKVLDYYNTAETLYPKKNKISNDELENLLSLSQNCLKDNESWFAIFASTIAEKSSLSSEKIDEIRLVELEALIKSFQVNPAIEKIKKLETRFAKNVKFIELLKTLDKIKNEKELYKSFNENKLEKETLRLTKSTEEIKEKRTKNFSPKYYPNDYIDVFSIKVFDSNIFEKTKQKIFYEQFDINENFKIGVEVIFSNPYFRIEDKIFDCSLILYIDDLVSGRTNFALKVDKDWDSVIFNQSFNNFNTRFVKTGQAKVELYVEGFKVCEKYFYLDNEFIKVEEEKSEIKQEKELPKIDKQNKSEKVEEIPPARPLTELLAELDSFIGMTNVKKAIRDFIAFLEFREERKKLGLKADDTLSIHTVFTGNPGTGKTTIARLLGEIFKSMKILPKGHVIEVDRSALVGQYIGETAQKTDKLIQDAIGGVLFIDEAYTLYKKGGGQDFGQEAIDILLKRMEDKKGEFAVIVAGYPDEMNDFLSSNPGLQSRFNNFFNFEDYSPDELIEIFAKLLAKEEYTIENDALQELKKEFTRVYRKRDKTFGNGRYVRQVFDKIKLIASKRFLSLPEEKKNKESLTKLIVEDITTALESENQKNVKLPIDEDALNESLSELNKLIGLSSVKKDVNDLVKLVRYFIEQGEDVKEKFSSHILFLGNPGTGKTTVARILSKIYSSLSIIPKGHLVETDRQGLVASHVGGTAEKTTEMINKAIGGVLFIDEAYTLSRDNASSSDFGREAIDTLLKRMEDDRGKFIVIAAGYTEEMQNFINSNPGIQSRFTKSFVFEDYSPEEMMEIAKKILSSKQLNLDDETSTLLKNYFTELYENRDKYFGNARVVRNTIEKIIQAQLLRVADLSVEERNKINTNQIIAADLISALNFKKSAIPHELKTEAKNLDELLEELNSLSGLDKVKNYIQKLINNIKVINLKLEKGIKVIENQYNFAFVGNPGTGKTTVAKILTKILKELGKLQNDTFIKVGRSDLIINFRGQTKERTEAVLEKAKGGMLFIDEPYKLVLNENDFGIEALDVFYRAMSDKNCNVCFILSGDNQSMEKFLNLYPDFDNKLLAKIEFENYTPWDLLEITNKIAENLSYKLDEGALQITLEIFNNLVRTRENNFTNAHIARELIHQAISNQEERIANKTNISDEELSIITYEDLEKIPFYDL